MKINPLFQIKKSNTTRVSGYELQEVNAFTPVTDYVVTHEKNGHTGSTATRWAITEDGDLVVQKVTVSFGESTYLQEGLVQPKPGFRVGGPAVELIEKWLNANGAMFEDVEGITARVAYVEMEGAGYMAVWLDGQKNWISFKALSEQQMENLMTLSEEPLVGSKAAIKPEELFELAVAQA